MTRRLLAAALAATALAAAAFGDEKPAEKPTFEALLVKPEELPKDVKLVEGLHCASAPPAKFFATPSMLDVADADMKKRILASEPLAKMAREFPKPLRTASQSFQADGGVAGSVLVFEYAPGASKLVTTFLKGYLWDKDGPNARYPESMHVAGDVVAIVSFPQGDAAAEWFKGRLRKRFGVPAGRWTPELARVMSALGEAEDRQDAARGLKLLAENEKLLDCVGLAHFLRGDFAQGTGDHALSEKGYRRALELHESRDDPMEPELLWADLNGLGGALVVQKKLDDAAKTLERAAALGRAGRFKGWDGSLYNLACARALQKRWDLAFAALKESIDVAPKRREDAKSDDDLAEARKRPEFAKLLGL